MMRNYPLTNILNQCGTSVTINEPVSINYFDQSPYFITEFMLCLFPHPPLTTTWWINSATTLFWSLFPSVNPSGVQCTKIRKCCHLFSVIKAFHFETVITKQLQEALFQKNTNEHRKMLQLILLLEMSSGEHLGKQSSIIHTLLPSVLKLPAPSSPISHS